MELRRVLSLVQPNWLGGFNCGVAVAPAHSAGQLKNMDMDLHNGDHVYTYIHNITLHYITLHYIHTYIHANIPTYLHTYIHT